MKTQDARLALCPFIESAEPKAKLKKERPTRYTPKNIDCVGVSCMAWRFIDKVDESAGGYCIMLGDK